MVTETVNVRFVETGARVIKRRIDEIGVAADKTTRGIFLLKRALFVIGGAGIARGLASYADSLTNVENRLRLTTDSTAQLEAVQSKLFQVARNSRSDFAGTADVYNRIALSAKNLGVGQQEILNVTETLNKAAILSGASAREANAALVQLGQGIASDRLSGDELRSVLEQLPAVADILVDYLNDVGTFGEVTRGTLRKLGKEGKLTAEIVVNAVSAAKGNIDELFSQTDITIDQAFNNLETGFLELLDSFEDAFKLSNKFAILIDTLSKNLDVLAFGVVSVGVALGAFVTAKALDVISTFVTKLKIAGGALARLRSIQSTVAASSVASSAALAADTRSRVANLTAINVRSAAQVNSARLEYAEATAAFQNGRARDLLTGRFVANAAARDRLTAASVRLANAERVNLALSRSLTGARTASIAADNVAAGAATRAGAAQAARAGVLARLSATFPLLAGAARLAAAAVSALFLVLAANPYTALITVIALATIALFTFGNRIKVTEDGVVGLKDAAIAAFQLITEAIVPVTNFLSESFRTAIENIKAAFGIEFPSIFELVKSVIFGIIDTITFLSRVAIGVLAGINAAWDSLPGAVGTAIDTVVDIFVSGFENLVNIAFRGLNKIIRGFNSLAGTRVGDALGLKKLNEQTGIQLDNLRTNFGKGAKGAGEAFTEGFTNAFEAGKIENVLDNFGNRIIERARKNIAEAELNKGSVTTGDPESTTPTDGGGNKTDFASELAELQQKIDLEKQFGIQKEITNNILSIEKTIKRELTAVERDQVANATRLLEISKIQGEVLQSILGPQETLRFTQSALNELFAQGAITLEQYNTKLRETQIAADRAAGTLSGGFKAAIASSIQSASQFGSTLGDFVVGQANAAADAIVEFAKTGQFNIRQFFQDLFAQLLKLAAQRLLLSLLGGLFGAPGAGLSGLSQGGSILPSFAGGGSMMPNGPGSTDTQLVAFNKRPDERVDVLTPSQQSAQRNNMNTGGRTTVNNTTNVAAVISPSDIQGAFDNADGETIVVNMIQRNASTIRQIIGN